MRRLFSVGGVVALVLTLAVTPAAARTVGSHAAASKFSVGLVTDVGGINDKSFNHLAYVGLEKAKTNYHIKADYIESHSEADYVPNLTHFAASGYRLTIAVGFLMSSAIYQVAKEYPNRRFAIIDAAPADAKGNSVNLPNVANIFFHEQESGYLVGILAGLMEKNHVGKARHNAIGYMGGLSIPPVNRYIAGYVAGARHADPSIRILGGYSQSFTDQGKGNSIGLSQISQGADILFQVAGSSGLGYLAAAQQRGVYGIGVDANQGYLGAFVLTSALKKVDVAVDNIIVQDMRGHWKGGDHQFSLKNNATGFAKPSYLVPTWVTAQVKAYQGLIKRGTIVPPTTIPK